MASIEELAKQLTNPAPRFEDPEEDVEDVTRARVSAFDYGENDNVDLEATQLRRQAGLDSLESDERYKGKKTSRKDLYDLEDSVSGDESDEDEEIDSDEADEDAVNEKGDKRFAEEEEEGLDSESDEEGEAEDGTEEDDEEIPSDEAESTEAEDEEESDGADGVRQFSAVNREDEVAKGKAVVAQLGLWDCLMEGRIRLQKVLSSVNSLPKPEVIQQLQKEGNPVKQQLTETHAQLQALLSVLLQLQVKLLCDNPETKSIASSTSAHSPSKKSLKRGHEEEEGEAVSAKRFAAFRTYRNETLEKWDNNTRLGSKLKSFNAFNTSVLKQIDQVMSDKDRLLKRTQVNRMATSADTKVEAAYDVEVFSDDDFYHILLRDLIERKNDFSDTVDITRQWLEIQKIRSKVKRKDVDTRASKGRKLRYNIHKKMVNFMAPVDTSTWSTEAKNDLFKSLFKHASAVEMPM